ncbi:MAG: holo-ACP synthase [Coriobacteriales bacterium]|jgi:holo-[acyl-carrier protein] synthase
MPEDLSQENDSQGQDLQEETKVPETGLGVDIVEVARMEKILQRSPHFSQRNFSDQERAYCEAHHRPAVHYATHFAAKEAVLKALGTGFSRGIGPTDVEVRHLETGRPIAVLHGRAKEVAAENGVTEIAISLSRTNETAIANAVALTEASRPRSEEKVTPQQKLAQRFKDLRGMLDEMPESPQDSAAPSEEETRASEEERR